MKINYEEEKETLTQEFAVFGCPFCWDSRTKKEKELMFFDQANNLRTCKFCPWCGREFGRIE